MKLQIPFVLALTLSLLSFANAAAPKGVITSPDNGEIDVAPDVKEIRVEFDQPMDSRGRSIVGGGDSFPQISGDIKWLDDKTIIIPVTLKPDHQYHLSINSDTFKGFCNKSGQPAEWYPVGFSTRAEGAAPAKPDATPGQNKAAVAALKQAVDQDYAYRDLTKTDWAKQIAAIQTKLENAASANEFARLTAHLLRQAEDGHVSVQAGDVHIGTRANSSPPNFDVRILQQTVPGWTEHPTGIITGRFDDGIGYILFSECTPEQAEGFDAALAALKDTTGLIIDARFNGGGDEDTAQRVAGRFVEKSAIYSRDRLRQGGNWTGPFDRSVEPRKDAPRYTRPVVVLIGPKVVSSAESFVLMMKYGAKAKLIGDATGGSSGRPTPHPLGNGVTVYLPSWEDQLPDGSLLESHGIRPDLAVKTTLRSLANSDSVIEAALKYLRSAVTGEKASRVKE